LRRNFVAKKFRCEEISFAQKLRPAKGAYRRGNRTEKKRKSDPSRPSKLSRPFEGRCRPERFSGRGIPFLTPYPAIPALDVRAELPLINKNGQPDQRDSDDPQNDVLAAAIFFVSHREVQAYPKNRFSSTDESTTESNQPTHNYGFAAAVALPAFL
jgi:hypothetical protein